MKPKLVDISEVDGAYDVDIIMPAGWKQPLLAPEQTQAILQEHGAKTYEWRHGVAKADPMIDFGSNGTLVSIHFPRKNNGIVSTVVFQPARVGDSRYIGFNLNGEEVLQAIGILSAYTTR